MSALLAAFFGLAPAQATAEPHITTPPVRRLVVSRTEHGVASVWSTPASRSRRGEVTRWGSIYRECGLLAAHRTAPRSQGLRVTCLDTGRSVIVVCADRGPFVAGRIVDLSPPAAEAIGLRGYGRQRLGRVLVEWVRWEALR